MQFLVLYDFVLPTTKHSQARERRVLRLLLASAILMFYQRIQAQAYNNLLKAAKYKGRLSSNNYTPPPLSRSLTTLSPSAEIRHFLSLLGTKENSSNVAIK